ncbi:MAG TPA: preprotein translocase subunit SecY [Armatimonadota bacterium]|nr:preprotein translocase subunit SecY [Armatimonadota bacterium]
MPTQNANWRESIARLGQAWQVPDLRRRILFVAGMFALYVFGLHVPAPFVNPEAIEKLASTGIFGLIDIMSGGAFRRLSILALGIVPYINASIIMQLLGIAVPSVQRLQKEGDTGRQILSKYTRWGTVVLAILQAAGLGIYLQNQGAVDERYFGAIAVVPLIIVMAAGTSFLMWVGEQLTDKGIGNGVSLIIFAGILIRLPSTFGQIFNLATAQAGQNPVFGFIRILLIILIFVLIVVFITYVHQATRQIPIQHAKRVVGNRVFNSGNTYLPLKVVTAGVIPIIFAISIVMLPATIAQMLESRYQGARWIEYLKLFSPGYSGDLWSVSFHLGQLNISIPFGVLFGGLLYFLLVVFFTYFYTAVVYNVQDISDNLKKHGSFIPGLRPGKQTEQYIDTVLTRITFAGALFLGVVALLPYIIPSILGRTGGASVFPLWGGTSLLIVVGVALESMKQLEAHLVMRHYEGFIK